jgi:hypothetical protein
MKRHFQKVVIKVLLFRNHLVMNDESSKTKIINVKKLHSHLLDVHTEDECMVEKSKKSFYS